MEWVGYVKDQMNITAEPKAFVRIRSCNISEDLLTSATSSFVCLEIDDCISNGDIFLVTDTTGERKYLGVITSIENAKREKNISNNTIQQDPTINTKQIQHIYAGTWLYDLPNMVGAGDDKKWSFERYASLIPEGKKTPWSTSDLPTIEDLEGQEVKATATYNDSAISISMNIGDTYTAKATTYVYSEKRQKVTLRFNTDNGGILYLNDSKLCSHIYSSASTYTNVECMIRKGWNKVEVVYSEEDGGDGWIVTVAGTRFNSFFSKQTSTASTDVDSLEDSFAEALKIFASGQMRDSTYTDPLVKQRLGDISIKVGTRTKGSFVTQSDDYTCDMEDMIYSLYDKYQIMLDFDIPYSGPCSVTITKSTISSIKIGNNTNSIVDISPVTEVEETNRLIIYNEDGSYRTTYTVKSDGTREQEPISTANRFGVVNTSIVFSDDEDDALIEDNLPETMYNHKLTFNLRLLSNSNLYTYDDLILGMPLEVWKDTEYFSTVLTGRSLSKEENANVSIVAYTCGTVRTTLTEKLLRRYGVIG